MAFDVNDALESSETTAVTDERRFAGLKQPFNYFNVDVIKLLYQPDGDNVFFSSVSIASAFAMVFAVADGDSGQQLIEGLRFNGMSAEQVHDKFAKVLNVLKSKQNFC